jgi:prolyl oligopeptidase
MPTVRAPQLDPLWGGRGPLMGFTLCITFYFMSVSLLQIRDHELPIAGKTTVIDEYHGVKVPDTHRWLEEGENPAVKAWTNDQNLITRSYLDALADRGEVKERLNGLFSRVAASYGGLVSRGGRIFALKFQPPKEQHVLVVLSSTTDLDSEKVVLDPNEMEPKGHMAMDWFVPSPDGSLVAVSLSEYGSEDGTLYFYETETGRLLPDTIPRVQCPTGGGSAAWTPDGKAIYYTRYPRAGERVAEDLSFYQQIYCHQLGSLESTDVYSAGKDFPRIGLITLKTSRDGCWLLASVANGDGGEYAHYVLNLLGGVNAPWRQFSAFKDGVKSADFGCDGASLYLRSVSGAPRGKILRLPLNGSVDLTDATIVVPEGGAVIESFEVTASYLYVVDLIGGPSRIRRFDHNGENGLELPIPAGCGVSSFAALADSNDDDRVLYRQTSFIQPDAWWLYDPSFSEETGRATITALVSTSPVDFSDIEVVREFAVSKDGTRIPLNIIRRKETALTGKNPTLLYGYGGYGHSLRPQFNFTQRLWFDRGGVYVVANIRGGGEYGEEWHLNGNLTRKQNVFDDFAACAQYLIDSGYTCSAKLAVEGRSNGGLLMGAFLTQHPQLARAVVSHVGIYDMLRVELDPNGAFNVTEFGTVKNAAQFRALHAYSPYHNVVDGTDYPSVMLLAGERDGRVNPANSRRMAARLQEATTSANPILVRLSSGAGHGAGTSLTERIAEQVDVITFLYSQLKM